MKKTDSINKRLQKKSQVTVFIIIGIVILLAVGAFIYMKSITTKSGSSLSLIQEESPREFKPIQSFITQCLKEVSEEAIRKIGIGGGHIDLTDPLYSTVSYNLDKQNPTESDGIIVSDDQKLLYWNYMSSGNGCSYNGCYVNFEVPVFDEMNVEIETYVNNNVEACFNKFTAFEKDGTKITPLSDFPETTVDIAKKDVVVQLKYPIDIKKGSLNHRLEYYNIIHPVNLRGFYDTAFTIANAEARNRFLEKGILYVMSFYRTMDPEKLPPLIASSYKPEKIKWSKTAVKTKIQDLIKAYTPLFKVENTKNGDKITSDKIIDDNIYNYLYLKNSYEFLKDYDIRFYYLDWPLYVDVTPSKGDEISPDMADHNVADQMTVTTNNYRFMYDIAAPILVEIKNKDDYDGKGYSFFFALEANIKNNYDIYTHMTYASPKLPDDLFEVEHPEALNKEKKIMTDNGDEITIGPAEKLPNDHIFCEDEQREGPKIDFIIQEDKTNKPIETANIFLICGPFFQCRIGQTDADGKAAGKLPYCNGGAIKVEHKDYHTALRPFDESIPNMAPDKIVMKLSKPITKKFVMRVLNYEDLINVPDTMLKNSQFKQFRKQFKDTFAYEEFGKNVTITAMFTRISENAYTPDFTRVAKINLLSSKMESEIELVPADVPSGYNVEIMYINHSVHIMPYEDDDNYYNKKDEETGKEVHVTSEKVDNTMPGAARLNADDNYPWNINYNDLLDPDKDVIIFYIIKMKMPEYAEGIKYIADAPKHSKKYRWFIQPELISSKDLKPAFKGGTGGLPLESGNSGSSGGATDSDGTEGNSGESEEAQKQEKIEKLMKQALEQGQVK
ncbi:MAG: hypothetical protein ABIG89_07225 [Candidatus Woesearchaeota archaeon]